MQTTPEALRISAISHSQHIQLNTQAGQVILDDTRLRNWNLAVSGGLITAYVARTRLNGDGELVRIRTLAGNTLEITYAAPLDVMTWSGNAITADALLGTGVDLFADGNNLDAFWFDADGVTVMHASSTDGGHTWGTPESVFAIPTQGAGVLPQLTAPFANVVVFSDSTVGEDASGNPLTGLYVVNSVASVWQTPALWGLGGQPLGIETPVTLPDGTTYPANLSSLALSETSFELAWYGANSRETGESGIWIQRVANLDTAGVTQHLHWTNPEMIFASVPLDEDNNATQLWCGFARLQTVGAEEWVCALEVSLFANVQKYHFGFFRASDAQHYSDRIYNQGATPTVDEQVGAYVYNGGTPFLLTDLIYGNLVVTDARTFIVGYDKVFYCPSTSLVGVDNPNMQLDLTANIPSRELDAPTSPTAAGSTYSLWNPRGQYNNSRLLTAHRGIRVIPKAGYVTSIGNELLQLAVENLDAFDQDTELPKNQFALTTIDNAMLLQRFKYDIPWEWFGSQQIAYTQFCDLSFGNVLWGNYTTSRGGRLLSGVVTPADNFHDNVVVLLANPSSNGILEVLVRCDITWGGTLGSTRNYGGIMFQCSLGANDEFWAVLYNKVQGKFSIHQAIPRANENRHKLYRYRPAVATSDPLTLDADKRYWWRVEEWQNHLLVMYATDSMGVANDDWTTVIDYTAPATPVHSVLPSNMELWGLIGTQRTNPSAAVGQNSGVSGGVPLSNGTSARYFALRVRTGSTHSTLRKINITLTQENPNGDPLPNVITMLVTGSASSPDDISDADNIVYPGEINALELSNHSNPAWVLVNVQANPALPRLDADSYYWIVAVLNNDLVSGQTYNYWSDNTGTYGTDTTQYSDDGVTWTGLGSLNMRASMQVDYDAGKVKFLAAHFVTGDEIQTQETLVHHLSAKCGILDCDFDDFLSTDELTLGPDNILWQPVAFGTLTDMVLDATVTPNGDTVEAVLAATEIDNGSTFGYRIVLSLGDQTISFYNRGTGTRLGSFPALNTIPTVPYRVRFAMQRGFLLAYINETLVGMQYVGTVDATTGQLLSPSGYVGLVQNDAVWADVRIPDLYHALDYFELRANAVSMQGLTDLLAKPTAGNMAQAKWFVRYNGHLRCSTFTRQVSTDTYVGTLIKADKIESAQYVVSDLNSQGGQYARHVAGKLLDSDGRWFDQQDYTAAFDDESAYQNGALVFQDAEEKAEQYTLEVVYNPAAEREDRITVRNPVDGTSGDYIINDIRAPIPELTGSVIPMMTLGLRKAAGA